MEQIKKKKLRNKPNKQFTDIVYNQNKSYGYEFSWVRILPGTKSPAIKIRYYLAFKVHLDNFRKVLCWTSSCNI